MIGVLTDLISAATGVFVIPAVPYIGALNLDKEDMIQALGLSFTVATIALALALAADGRSRLATSALQPPRLRQRFSAWRRAAGGGRRLQREDLSADFLRRIAGAGRSPCVAGGDVRTFNSRSARTTITRMISFVASKDQMPPQERA